MKGDKKTKSNLETNEQPAQALVIVTDNNQQPAENLLQYGNIDDIIKNQIEKYQDVVPDVEDLKKRYMSLKVNDINDDEGYQTVSVALRDMVKTRNDIERKRKELKADSLKFGNAVDAEAKKITELITPIEQHLRAEKEKVDEEKERIRLQKEAEQQDKILNRHNLLQSIGMNLFMDSYTWQSKLIDTNTLSMHRLNVETMDDEVFDEEVDKFKTVIYKEKAELEKIENELRMERERQDELRRQEEEALAEQRRQQELEAEKIRQQQEQLQKERELEAEKIRKQQEELQKERQQMIDMRSDLRRNQIESLGLIKMKYEYVIIVQNVPVVILYDDNIQNMSKEEWDLEFPKWAETAKNLKEKEARLQEEKKAELQKQAELDAEIKLKKQQEAEEAEEIRIKQEEEEHLKSLTDKELLKLYAANLLEVAQPVLKTAKWKKEIQTALSYITELYNKTS